MEKLQNSILSSLPQTEILMLTKVKHKFKLLPSENIPPKKGFPVKTAHRKCMFLFSLGYFNSVLTIMSSHTRHVLFIMQFSLPLFFYFPL